MPDDGIGCGIPRVVYQLSPPRRRPRDQEPTWDYGHCGRPQAPPSVDTTNSVLDQGHAGRPQAPPTVQTSLDQGPIWENGNSGRPQAPPTVQESNSILDNGYSGRPQAPPTGQTSPATPQKANPEQQRFEQYSASRPPPTGVLSPRDENLPPVQSPHWGAQQGAQPQPQPQTPQSSHLSPPQQDRSRVRSPSAITAADLLDDPAAFQEMAAVLISRHVTKQFVSPRDLLLTTLNADKREAFAKALEVKHQELPTFPEPGEPEFFTLIRDVERVFGRALRALLTMSPGQDRTAAEPTGSTAYGDENNYLQRPAPQQDLQSQPHYGQKPRAGPAQPAANSFGINYQPRPEMISPHYRPFSPSGTVHPDGEFGYRRMENFEADHTEARGNAAAGSESYAPPTVPIHGNGMQPTVGEPRGEGPSPQSTVKQTNRGGIGSDEHNQGDDGQRKAGEHIMTGDQSVAPTIQTDDVRDDITLQSALRTKSQGAKAKAKNFEESYEAQAARRQRLFEEMEHTTSILRATSNDEVRVAHLNHLKDLRQEWEQLKRSASPTQESARRAKAFQNKKKSAVSKKLWKGEQIILRPPDGGDDKSVRSAKSIRSVKSTLSNAKSVFDDEKSTASGPATRPMGKRTVNVVAPETLPANFTFEARLGDNVFMATVPDGGVAKGDIFPSVINDINIDADRATVRVRTMLDMGAPTKRWRDELFDCCSEGMGHPLLCNSIFCPQVALAQVMARMQMMATGSRGITLNSRLKMNQVILLTIGAILIHIMYFAPLYIRARQRATLYFVSLVPLIVMDFGLMCYFWFLVARTRKVMRDEYDIPQIHCRCLGCEDWCLAICCSCCTIAQMGRHSADYTTYRSMCCTDTGLPNHVEVKLPSDPMYAEFV